MRHETDIEKLRGRIAAIERGRPEEHHAPVATGFAAIDRHLPGGGLRPGRLHDILAAPGHAPSAAGFAARLAGRFAADGRDVLWCLSRDDLYGHGLGAFGLMPERLILAWGRRPEDLLWSMEEGLRCNAIAAVVGDCLDADALAQRRLQLAAEEGGGACLLLRETGRGRSPAILNTPESRWLISAAPSPTPQPVPGSPAIGWRVELQRMRAAQPAKWVVTTGGGHDAAILTGDPGRREETAGGHALAG